MRNKQLIYISIVISIFMITAYVSAIQEMHTSISNPKSDYHRDYFHNAIYGHQIGVAVSSLRHGLNGYLGYSKVKEHLISHNLSNTALNQSVTLDDEEKKDIYSMGQLDFGVVDYFKLSFLIFGYNTEGFTYLYFVLLFISILLFCIQYSKNDMAMYLLILYLSSQLMIINAFPTIGAQAETVYNFRVITILGILPLIHLILLIRDHYHPNTLTIFIAIIQASLMIFVLWIRSSALWLVLYLVFFNLILFFVRVKRKNKRLTKSKFNYVLSQTWPTLIVLLMVFSLSIHKHHIESTSYNGKFIGHLRWWSIYIGLAVYPDISSKYSDVNRNIKIDEWSERLCKNNYPNLIQYFRDHLVCDDGITNIKKVLYIILKGAPDDQDAYDAVFQRLEQNNEEETAIFTFSSAENVDYKSGFRWFQYGSFDQGAEHKHHYTRKLDYYKDLDFYKIENILSEISFEILQNNFKEVLTLLVFVRPLQLLYFYLKYYIVINSISLLVIILIVLYSTKFVNKNASLEILKILTTIFLFSLIVPMIMSPSYYAISDTALSFNMCIISLILLFMNRLLSIRVVSNQIK